MRESKRGGQFDDEPCVFGRCPSSQGVIEMANNEISESRFNEEIKQRHGIRTTRDTHQPALAAGSRGEPRNILNDDH